MEWLITFILFAILQYWIWRSPFFKTNHLPHWYSNALFTAKALGGIALFFIYTLYYTNREQADIFKFYDDGLRLHQIISENKTSGIKILLGNTDTTTLADEAQLCNWRRYFTKTMINENRLLIRCNAVLSYITLGYYQIHNLLFCFLSFLGFWTLTKTITPFLSKRNALLWGILLFSPSILIWTDGLLKESVLMFCVGLSIWCIRASIFNWKKAATLVFCLMVLTFTKTILAIIMVVALVGYRLSSRVKTNRAQLAIHSSLYLLLLIVALILPHINPLYDYFKVIAKKQRYTYEEAVSAHANSVVELPRITKDPLSVISSIPLGFFYAVAEPMPWQAKGKTIILINALENIVVLLFLLFLLVQLRKSQGERAALFWLLLFVAVIYLSFIGLLVPVLGNVVRYKAVVMPLLLGSLLLLQKDNKQETIMP